MKSRPYLPDEELERMATPIALHLLVQRRHVSRVFATPYGPLCEVYGKGSFPCRDCPLRHALDDSLACSLTEEFLFWQYAVWLYRKGRLTAHTATLAGTVWLKVIEDLVLDERTQANNDKENDTNLSERPD